MQHANGKRIVKRARKGQMIDIGLDHVGVFQFACCRERRLDRRAEIDANNLARAPTRGQLRVPAFAATALQHDFVFEEFAGDRYRHLGGGD